MSELPTLFLSNTTVLLLLNLLVHWSYFLSSATQETNDFLDFSPSNLLHVTSYLFTQSSHVPFPDFILKVQLPTEYLSTPGLIEVLFVSVGRLDKLRPG
ncbi:hypothetical protein EDD18DRAFT_1168062 [Armillaria luteobubalina]|uniref:Uncharacterized protein n=1 Tax=Armillaria luteobubalina TaxID=153913 RepID=A0AA39Q5Z9_9AGAR|nr:hypothetical protein EDD18DRAFT_1168062 [Armillaria luteobubalina]